MFIHHKSRAQASIWLAVGILSGLLLLPGAYGDIASARAAGAEAPRLLALSGSPAGAAPGIDAESAAEDAARTACLRRAPNASLTANSYAVTELERSIFVFSGFNARGQFTGSMVFPSAADEHAFLYNGGSMLDLGTLSGTTSLGEQINDAGHVAGLFGDGLLFSHPFLYDGRSARDIGTLGGPYASLAGLGERDQVAGTADLTDGLSWHAFLYEYRRMKDLGTLGGSTSSARAINDAGFVVGQADTAANRSAHAFIHDGRRMRDLGTLGGNNSSAEHINAAGQIVGQSQYAPTRDEGHAFFYQRGRMRDLGTLGGSQSFAVFINAAGQTLGNSLTAGDREWHPFFHDGRNMHDLGSLGGIAFAYVMNARGQIVGASLTSGNAAVHGFVWSPGDAHMSDLNTRLLNAPPGIEIQDGHAISDKGVIIAASNLGFVLLTPTACAPTTSAGTASLARTPADRQAVAAMLKAGAAFSAPNWRPQAPVALSKTARAPGASTP